MTGSKFCALATLGSFAALIISFVFGGFAPPPTHLEAAGSVAQYYRDHGDQLMLFGILTVVCATLFIPTCCGLSLAMMRMQPRSPLLALLQLTGGLFACIGPFVAGMVILTPIIRPDTTVAVFALMNDFTVVLLVVSTLPMLFQGIPLGMAILMDRSENPILPRWLAWISITWGIVQNGGVLSVFFDTGPFAPTGMIGVILPAVMLIAFMSALVVGFWRITPQQWAGGESAAWPN